MLDYHLIISVAEITRNQFRRNDSTVVKVIDYCNNRMLKTDERGNCYMSVSVDLPHKDPASKALPLRGKKTGDFIGYRGVAPTGQGHKISDVD